MWIFVMFWIIFVPAILLFWRLRFIWRPARANIDQAPAPTASSENQGSLTETSSLPQNQQPNITHEIEEVVETEEESPSVDSSRSTASMTVSTESIGCRKRSCYAWGNKSCAFLAGIGGLVVGYLTMVTGGILEVDLFLRKVSREIYLRRVHSHQDDFCWFRSQWLFLHSSVIHFMAIVGMSMPFFCIHAGRRHVIKIAAVLVLIGIGCMSWFPHVSVEVIGMLLSGCGAGLISQVVPTVYSEIMPENIRAVDIFHWGSSLGGILAATSIYIASVYLVWGWRFTFSIVGVPGLLLLAISFLMTESPKFLIEHGSIEKAKRVLKSLRASSDIEVEHAQLVAQVENQQSKNPFKELLSPLNRPTFIITTTDVIFGKLSGVDLIIFFGPFLFESISYMQDNKFLAPVVLATVQTVAKAVGLLLLPMIGRRRMFMAGYIAIIIPMVCLGIIFILNENPSYHLKPHRATLSIALMLIYTIGGGILSGPYGLSDLKFSEECAAVGYMYVLGLGFLATFIGNQVFLHILCLLRERMFFFHATFCFAMMCFMLLFIPETTGITQQTAIRRVWQRHWFWRRYMS